LFKKDICVPTLSILGVLFLTDGRLIGAHAQSASGVKGGRRSASSFLRAARGASFRKTTKINSTRAQIEAAAQR
jgi:hypothetical protein